MSITNASDATPRHALPQLQPAQAAKHATVNAALERLDGALHAHILGPRTRPPEDAQLGACFRIISPATDLFAGREGQLAVRGAGGWNFHTPGAGWTAWHADTESLRAHDGSDWVDVGGGSEAGSAAPEFTQLGVGTAADPNHAVAVRGDSSFLNAAEDGSHRLYINRETTDDVAGLILQTGFSSQAEIALAGPAGLSIRTSTDGENWQSALEVDTASGRVSGTGLATGEQRVRLLSGSGTYTVPDGVVALHVEVQGAGGGGAGATTTSTAKVACAGGGGGGGYVSVRLSGDALSPSYTYAVGAGGAGGALAPDGSGNRDGGHGGESRFVGGPTSLRGTGGSGARETPESSSFLAYGGGSGGAASSAGTGESGATRLRGQNGQGGLIDGRRAFFTGNGQGGSAHLGAGGAYTNGNGSAGSGYGGGGAGAGMVPGMVLDRKGGAGAEGIIRVTEFY